MAQGRNPAVKGVSVPHRPDLDRRRRLGFVVGFAAEARLLLRHYPQAAGSVEIAGADPARAATAADSLIHRGCDGVVSLGYCGALLAKMPPGTILLAESIVMPDGKTANCDDDLIAALAGALAAAKLPYHLCSIAGSDRAIATAEEKARLGLGTEAHAVDMESHGIMQAATAAERPMAVLRIVLDPAERDLPRAALVALGPDGKLRPAALIGALLRRPSEILGLLRLARDARAARLSLGRAAAALARGLG
jgi:adenosylhomocysteine nucleosidase